LIAYAPIGTAFAVLGAYRGENDLPWVSWGICLSTIALAVASRRLKLGHARSVATALVVVGIALFLGWALARPLPTPDVESMPDLRESARAPVILIVLDTLRADHLGLYGYPRDTSPALDEFASAATVFERCISTSSWTVPAHASILTGLYPRSHGSHLKSGVNSAELGLAAALRTLPEVLKEAGYQTGAVVANSWLRAGSGFEQGFGWFEDSKRHPLLLDPWMWMFANVVSETIGPSSWIDSILGAFKPIFTPYPTFEEMASSAIDWIDRSPERPFFLFMNAMEAHDPFEPPPPFRDRWAGRHPGRVPFHHVRAQTLRGEHLIDQRLLEHFVSQYDGEIAYLDRQLGRFFDELRVAGVFDQSWIIITSDHGEHFGEHGLLWHRTSLYRELVHVPMIVKRPNQLIGDRVGSLVQLTDIMPTLLRENDIPLSDRLPEDAGLWSERTTAFSELYYDEWIVNEHGPDAARSLFSLETANEKLIFSKGETAAIEVYDVNKDPGELENLAASRPDAASRLADRLDRFVDSLPDPPTTSGRSEDELDEATLRRLRSLGYVE
jgi:arylsulfatase A-like enzyme